MAGLFCQCALSCQSLFCSTGIGSLLPFSWSECLTPNRHFLKMGNVAHNFLHLLAYPLDNTNESSCATWVYHQALEIVLRKNAEARSPTMFWKPSHRMLDTCVQYPIQQNP